MQILTILVFVVTITYVHSGLLKVPKIYNAVITSDANLEPSRTYPIVQPVLSVQPVIAAAAIPAVPHPAEKQHTQQYGGYYPIALGGLYPFLSGTNNLYPTVYYQQPQYASGIYHQQQEYPQEHQQPYPQEQHQQQYLQPQPPQQQQYIQPQPPQQQQQQQQQPHQQQILPPQPQEPPRHQELPSSAMQVPDSSHHHADPFNNHHRFKNPGIPDVPPPPLPVSASKKSS